MVSKKYVIIFFNLYLNDFVNEISCIVLLSVARLKALLQRYDEAKILEPGTKPVSVK